MKVKNYFLSKIDGDFARNQLFTFERWKKNKLQFMVIRKKIANKEIGNALDKNYVDNQNEKF